MAEEEQTAEEAPLTEDELDLDTESAEDIESAMQEALAAVETARAKRESGDEIQAPGQPTVGNAEVGEVAKLEETVAELRDRSQRTLADFENFRRRVDRERQEDRRFAAFDTLREFLAVVDNLERALASEGSTDDLKV